MYAFTGIGGHIWPFENDIVGHAASVYLSSNWLEKIDGERIYDHDVIVTDTSTGQTSGFF